MTEFYLEILRCEVSEHEMEHNLMVERWKRRCEDSFFLGLQRPVRVAREQLRATRQTGADLQQLIASEQAGDVDTMGDQHASVVLNMYVQLLIECVGFICPQTLEQRQHLVEKLHELPASYWDERISKLVKYRCIESSLTPDMRQSTSEFMQFPLLSTISSLLHSGEFATRIRDLLREHVSEATRVLVRRLLFTEHTRYMRRWEEIVARHNLLTAQIARLCLLLCTDSLRITHCGRVLFAWHTVIFEQARIKVLLKFERQCTRTVFATEYWWRPIAACHLLQNWELTEYSLLDHTHDGTLPSFVRRNVVSGSRYTLEYHQEELMLCSASDRGGQKFRPVMRNVIGAAFNSYYEQTTGTSLQTRVDLALLQDPNCFRNVFTDSLGQLFDQPSELRRMWDTSIVYDAYECLRVVR